MCIRDSGVVITHGTDTLEETAYFLDTMNVPEIPIVITGAMRSSNELGSDGFYNYLSALRVASDDKASDKGILVVMNDEIHAAKYVTKTHTTNVATFHTPTHGPLGIIMKHDILWFKTAESRVRFDLEQITGIIPIIFPSISRSTPPPSLPAAIFVVISVYSASGIVSFPEMAVIFP